MRERYSLDELEAQLACMNADLYQYCGTMPVTSLESLCRKINSIKSKINSFKKDRRDGNR